MARKAPKSVDIHPLTPERWGDFVDLFNRPGGSIVRGCWCMHYRLSGQSGAGMHGDVNKRAMKALVAGGTIPGLLGYKQGRPIAWLSLGPREDYARLQRSPVMKPVDERPVWSIVCFWVDPKERGRRVAEQMLEAAIVYARGRGATLIEAYPVDKPEPSHPDFMWFGAKRMFDRAGFTVVARRKPARPVMRRRLRPAARQAMGRGASLR